MKANFYGMPIFTGSRGPYFVGLKIIKSILSIIIHGGCTFEDMGNSKILSCNFCFQFNLKVGIQENILVLAFNDSTVFKNFFYKHTTSRYCIFYQVERANYIILYLPDYIFSLIRYHFLTLSGSCTSKGWHCAKDIGFSLVFGRFASQPREHSSTPSKHTP